MDKDINYYIEDFNLTDKQKQSEDYLVEYTDSLIDDLVNEGSKKRKDMITMRYFYHGKRDEREFQYLTENFGIGNPGSIKFIPIVRNRIEALIGLMALASFDWKLSLLDEDSVRAMADEKLNASIEALYSRINSYSNEVAAGTRQHTDASLQEFIKRDLADASENFQSMIVSACNNLIKVLRQDIDIDLFTKRKQLFEDLLVVGEAHYRVRPVVYGELPEFEVLIPENFYYDIRRDQKFIKNVHRVVYVRYLTIPEVMARYGHLLSKSDREDVSRLSKISGTKIWDPKYIEEQKSKDPDYRHDNDQKFVRVYECEWISGTFEDSDVIEDKQELLVEGPDKVGQVCRLSRYQTVRIESDIYVDMGKSLYEKRIQRKPLETTLTFNGIRFSDRVGEPYSLLWKCKDLQDMSDILYYHRDNTIANAGTKGSRVDVASIPTFLGKSMTKRVMKFLAYKKQGMELYDSSIEGGSFEHFGDFDNSMSGDAITAINAVLVQLDDEVSKQTGVTNQMLGIIEQREAVSNVKTGINQSSVVVKNLFDHNDTLTSHIVMDLVTASQESLKNAEYTGTYNTLVGPQIFTILPENFAFADYNIVVVHTSDEYMKLQSLREYASTMAQSGNIDPLIVVDLMAVESLHEASAMIKEYTKKAKEEGGNVQQLQEQVEQLQKELEAAQKKVSDYDMQKLAVEQQKAATVAQQGNKKLELEEKKNNDTNDYNSQLVALKQEGLKLERDQLYIDTDNKSNNEVKNY